MKDFIKKNFVIILAFVLPLVLIIGVVLSSYLPSLLVSTQYNFLYATCASGAEYYYPGCDNLIQGHYSVINNKLVVNSTDPNLDLNKNGIPDVNEFTYHIFLHNTKNNESKEITIEEAQKLNLSGLLTSPDGVSVTSGYDRYGGFFPVFDGGSDFNYYLTKGNGRSRLNLINSGKGNYYYPGEFKFIGWILP